MKPHEEAKQKLLEEWLRKADADMGVAEHLLSEDAVFPNAVTFHSQQAAEKYLKAFLTFREIDFPKTHDLQELLDIIEPVDSDIAISLQDIIVLTPYGVEHRYPGEFPDATPEEAREAVDLARKVRDSILPLVRGEPE